MIRKQKRSQSRMDNINKVNNWRAASSAGSGTSRVRLHSETDQTFDEILPPPPARKKPRISATARVQDSPRSFFALSADENNTSLNTTAAASAPIPHSGTNHNHNDSIGMRPPQSLTRMQSQLVSPAHQDQSASRNSSQIPSPRSVTPRELGHTHEEAEQPATRDIDYTQIHPSDSVRRRPLALISRRYIDSTSPESIGPSHIRSSLLFPIFEDEDDQDNGNDHTNGRGMGMDGEFHQRHQQQDQVSTTIGAITASTGNDNISGPARNNNTIQSRLMDDYFQSYSEENKENSGRELYIPDYWSQSDEGEHTPSDAEMTTTSQHPNSPVNGNAMTDSMRDTELLHEMAERASMAMQGIIQQREVDEDEMEIDGFTAAAAGAMAMAATRITGGAPVIQPGLAQATAEPAFPSLDGPPRRFPFGSAPDMTLAQSRGGIMNAPGHLFHGRRLRRML